jgi:hypothetical protein
MRLLKHLDFPDMQFALYFMGYVNDADIPEDPKVRPVLTES